MEVELGEAEEEMEGPGRQWSKPLVTVPVIVQEPAWNFSQRVLVVSVEADVSPLSARQCCSAGHCPSSMTEKPSSPG
ncbi:hypothetical protein I79_026004 [Cricetulus griseus]|uniref:Uncharacterized protein n=1 Tax=Cricetulus griseus TaxID=10029 RepID=G3IPS7_CRIGR|nr:hypothetical protein I79_026004 [Cricetulus griseus]